MKSKSLKKSIFLSVLAMLMLASIAVGGTYAYFTDSVSIDNNVITAGDISITAALTHESGTGSVDSNGAIQIANFAPGDTAEYKLTVTNVGSLDASYKVMATSTDPSLATALIFKYTVGTGGTQEDMTFTDDVFQTTWADIASTDPGATVEMFIDITFNASAGNNYQNTSFAFDINVLATQVGATSNVVCASTVDAINNATAGQTVILASDIVGDVSLTKAVNFDFNGHKLMGDLSITDNTASTIDIGDAGVDKDVEFITGDVNITAIAATVNFNVGANASKTITAATDNSSFHFNGGFVELDANNEVVGGSTEVGTITISAGRLVVNTPAKVVVAKKPTVAELGDNVTEAQIKDVAVVVAENVTAPSVTVEDTVSEQVAIENSGTITEVANNSSVKVEVVGTAPESSEGNIIVNGTITIANADTAWYYVNPEAENFEISTAKELLGVSKLVNERTETFAGKTIVLMADIDLSNAVWEPIGFGNRSEDDTVYFGGYFNGNNHTISGIKAEHNVDDEGVAVFGIIKNATISDLKVANSSFSNSVDYAAAIVGAILGDEHSVTKLYGCQAADDVVVSGNTVAGIVARVYSYGAVEIKGCTNNASVSGSAKAGGIAGIVAYATQGVFNDCMNYGAVYGENAHVGGILGYSGDAGTQINGCNNTAAIGSTSSKYAGGIVGYAAASTDKQLKITCCKNTGVIDAKGSIGGIVGIATNRLLNITECTNNAEVGVKSNAIADTAGGIIGTAQGVLTVSNCTNNTSVYARNAVGGVVGSSCGDTKVDSCAVGTTVELYTTNENYVENSGTVVMGIVRGAIVGKHREANLTLKNVSDFDGYELLSNFYTNGDVKFTLIDCTITNDIITETNAGELIVETKGTTTFNTYTVTKAARISVDNAIAIDGELVVNTLIGREFGATITFGAYASCDNEIFYTADGEGPGAAVAGTTYVWTMDETTSTGYWLAQ